MHTLSLLAGGQALAVVSLLNRVATLLLLVLLLGALHRALTGAH
jgi:hypothetical protein